MASLKKATIRIDWVPTVFLILSPILALLLSLTYFYLYDFSWGLFALFILFYSLTALSITAGYHRLWSHKAYDAHWSLQLFYAIFGAAAFQNSIYKWSVDHRLHHRHVDTDLDPYSIKKGFFFAHMGWMCLKQEWPQEAKAYERDLKANKIVMWQHRNYLPIAITAGFFLPALLGYFMGSALGGLAFGGFLRMVALHHGTFLINSACHWWGFQPYTKENSARDNLVLAFLTFGEGYHNFHHLFSSDYRNGIRWYHWDPTKWLIQLSSKLGVAFNLRQTDDEKIFTAKVSRQKRFVREYIIKNHPNVAQRWEHLTEQLETAQSQFFHLKREYTRLKKEKTNASQTKLLEIKSEMNRARENLKVSLRQWQKLLAQLGNGSLVKIPIS